MTVLETPRLLLRPIQLEDAQAQYEIRQHPDVYEFDGHVLLPDGSKRPKTLEEIHEQLEKRVGEFGIQGFGMWAVTLKENKAFVGWAGLQFYMRSA
jgi:ribosomal-protein-alanine N-acetyltransferase